jgi:shikimate dehydrogenase
MAAAAGRGAPVPISAATRVYALLGDPIAHSFSPVMQNAAFVEEGLDAVYVALRCDAQAAPPLARALALAGGGGNVTVPHKTAVAAALELRTDAVLLTGACNTFWSERGQLCGDNTDVDGFRAATDALVGSCAGARVLLIGAGGAARAAAVALASSGAAEVVLLNRSPARAQALLTDLAGMAPMRLMPADRLPGESFDLVVNATPLGLDTADPLPLDLGGLRRAGAALDLVCRPGDTAWIAHAIALGIPAAGGAAMLLAQGAAAFTCWWKRPAPLAAMRSALQNAIRPVPANHGGAPAQP